MALHGADITSLTGANWHQETSPVSEDMVARLAKLFEQQHDIPFALGQLLAKRGINADTIDAFIEPRLRDLLPDPSSFKDMDKACTILAETIIAKKPIGIFGDYDVDGACSAAIFSRFLQAFGVTAHIHIPDRFKEGYGPNAEALRALKSKGAELVITVDCGITAHEPLKEAASAGVDVIVIDHHQAGTNLPDALAVVNPNRLDDESGQGALCAAAMAFITCVGTMRLLRQEEVFKTPPIDLLSLLDLVAMATICDIVPLTIVNRAFVKQGIKIFKQRQNTGLRLLSDLSGVNRPPTAQTFGFVLGPRINAAGRIGNASLGAELLTTSDESLAVGIASQLEELNKQRKAIEAEVQRLATDEADTLLEQNPEMKVIIVAGEGWHEGVVGIVAGRLKDKYHRPAIVISLNQEGIGKGSARGISGFKLGDAIMAAHQAGLLLGGGGHDMAAGLSVAQSKLDDFRSFMDKKFSETFAIMPPATITISQIIALSACNKSFVDWIDTIAPFGSHFPEPKFMLSHCQIGYIKWLGEDGNHLSCQISDGTGAKIRAIAFRFKDKLISKDALHHQEGALFHIVGHCVSDDYRGGDAVQFQIDDIAIGK